MAAPIQPTPIPERERARVQANVAKMRAQGATEADVTHYLSVESSHVGLGGQPRFAADASAQSAAFRDPRILPEAQQGHPLTNAVRATEQGLTFGFGDEVNARLRSLSPNQTYPEAVQDERAKLDDFRARHPMIAGGLEIAGGVAPALATGGLTAEATGALAGKSLLRRAAVAGTEGAAFGGLYGAGTATEGHRLEGAARGAKAGALVGAALPMAGKALGAGLNAAGLRAATITAPAAPGSVMGKVQQLVGQGARQAVPATAEDVALQRIATDLERSGLTPQQALARAQELANGGKPAMLLDISEPLQRRARFVGTVPSKGGAELKTKLLAREDGLPTRLTGDVEHAVGQSRRDPVAMAEDIIQRRRAASQPAYEAAYAHGAVDDPEILALLTKPSMQAAYKRAQALAAEEGVPLADLSKIADGVRPDVRTLDYLKRGLDDLLAVGKRGGEGGLGPSQTRAIAQTKAALLEAMDTAVPEYAKARAIYGGESGVLDALTSGQDFLKTDHREVARLLGGMSEAEREAYRAGALDGIAKRIGTADRADLVKMIAGRGEQSEKWRQLQALIGDPAQVEALRRRILTSEGTMRQSTARVLGGSNTFDKTMDATDALGLNLGELATNGVKNTFLNRGIQALNRQKNGNLADALEPMLTAGPGGAGGTRDVTDVIRLLQTRPGQVLARGKRNEQLLALLAGGQSGDQR